MISDGLWAALTQVLGVVAGVAMVVVGARVLSVDDFAALAWGLGWVLYMGVVSRLGSMQASAVVIARAGAETARASALLLASPALFGVGAGIMWHFVLRDAILSATVEGSAYDSVAILVGFWIPIATLGPTMGALLRALGRFRASSTVGDWVRRASIAVALLVLEARGGVSVTGAIWIGMIAELVAVIAAFGLVLRRTNEPAPRPSPTGQTVTLSLVARWSLSFYVLSIASLMIPQSGVWLVSLIADTSEVAEYALAVRFALLFSLPFFVGSRVFAPRIARAAVGGELASLQSALRLFSGLAFGAIALIIVGFVVSGRWIIELIFGSEFSGSYIPTVLLAAAAAVNAATGLNRTVLVNSGDQRLVTVVTVSAAVLFVTLGMILGEPLGAVGVALAALVAQVTQDVWMLRAARDRHGVTTSLAVGRSTRRALA